MFAQVYKCEHYREREYAGVDYANDGARAHGRNGGITRGRVEESAVLEEVRRVGFEEKVAAASVGECAIAVVGVVPVLEGGEVPVDVAD